MKKKYRMAGILLLAAAAVCAAAGTVLYLQEKEENRNYDTLREEVKIPEEDEPSEGPDIPVDFDTLKEMNPDIYAWITIAGTSIDYPILQDPEDNSYYLTHGADRSESTSGAIYTELFNSTDFEDPNTVIYGHDMQDGSMFRDLLEYRDRTFFDANREVLIYTPDAVRHYRIFAAYVYDDRHLLRSFDFTDETVYRHYLEQVFAIRDMNACIDTSMEVGTEDKIITLSTCYGNQDRYLVQAVLETIDE